MLGDVIDDFLFDFDNIYPTLFNYAINFVLELALRGSQGVQVGGNLYLTGLMYADDIALLGDSAEAVQDALSSICTVVQTRGIAQDQGSHLRGPDLDDSALRLRDVACAC